MATPADNPSAFDRLRAKAAYRLGSMATTAVWAVSRQRIGFTLAICALVSTQAFFQPMLYDPFLPRVAIIAWRDYFGECLLMGTPIMVAATLAERWSAGRSRVTEIAATGIAIVAGAMVGALALVAYYGDGWSEAFGARYWVDVGYWTVLGSGVIAIYGFQKHAETARQRLHQAEVDRIALSKQMLEARLQVMRAQIEPHFLFNTLANVKRLCHTDIGDGLRMLDNLVRYLRAALPQMREAETTLGQEADLVEAFLAVLKIRMGTRLVYRIAVDPGVRGASFPPMMLLTLTENAIKHGLNPAPTGGSIEVAAALTGGHLEVRVADTGVGFGVAATGGTGVGLANTRARLAALYGDEAELSLAANAPTGVIAIVRIPLNAAATLPLAA
ncbi:MAG: histidine kinase [Casimicrobiaceae bacterium]